MHYQWVLRVVCILLGFYGKRGSLVLASFPLFRRSPQVHVLLLVLLEPCFGPNNTNAVPCSEVLA